MIGTLQGANDYHAARKYEAWAYEVHTDADRTAALLRASAALTALYGARLKGEATDPLQSDEFPRRGLCWRGAEIAKDVTPQPVEHAIYEMAALELATPGSLTPNMARGGKIKTAQAGSASVTFMDNAPGGTALTLIDGLLASFLKPKAGGFSTGWVLRA